MTLDAALWKKRHLASQIVKARCLLHLRLAGLEVVELAYELDAKDRHERQYPDDGDLMVVGRGRVECKGRSYRFGGKVPYPWPTVFLGESYQHEQHDQALYGFMIVDRDQAGFLWISATTSDRWRKEEASCPYQGRKTVNMACPTACAEWVSFRT